MSQGQAGGNVYNTASNAYNNSVNATQGAMGMAMATPTAQAQTASYTPFTGLNADGTAAAGFGAGMAGGAGYDPTMAAAARDVTAGQFSNVDISQYMNPYTSQVVDQTAADLERARLIEQNTTDDAMTAAGAFGGSRHGIANAETNRNYYDRLGATLGDLRNTGYQNAQQAAFQDIANQMQADLANQNSDLSTNQFNANAANQAGQTLANNRTSASIANANAQTQLAGQRLNAINSAGQFNANALNDTSRFNADAINTGNQNRFNNVLSGAGQLSGLSSQGVSIGNNLSDRQAADGADARALQQQLMDLAQQQFSNYSNQANLGLGTLQSGIASIPGGSGTTSSTSNPGLFGILGSLAAL